MKDPDIHQQKTHPEPSSTPGFSLGNALLGSLLAVVPGLILLQQGNVALGIPVAMTLGAVMFLLAGYSDGWRSFGLTLINLLGSLLIVTLGNVIGQRNAQQLLGLDSTPEPEEDAVSRLAARAELSAARAEQLVMALDTEGEPTAEQYDAVAALQAEMILVRMEEQEIRQYRLKRILACIAGTMVAIAVTLFLWFDYSRAEAGKPAWVLPTIWQEAEPANLLGFGFAVSFVWGTSSTLLLIAQQYRRVFFITSVAVAVIAYPVGWSLRSSISDLDLSTFVIVASAMITSAGFLFEPQRSHLLDELNALKDSTVAPSNDDV